ncbi:hypothetical protein QQ045_006892 [Rhodiola kirilowii]
MEYPGPYSEKLLLHLCPTEKQFFTLILGVNETVLHSNWKASFKKSLLPSFKGITKYATSYSDT